MRAPVLNLAIGLLISREKNAPPKPTTAAKPSSRPRFRPWAVKKRSTPSKLATMPNMITTARFVMTNRAIRFIVFSPVIRKVFGKIHSAVYFSHVTRNFASMAAPATAETRLWR